ncbi:MAG: type II secretion system protein GspN [Spirochaetota bacterium]|nr:type II secretion system protein GspN [Spirochaetota bacterium]
MDLRDLEKRIIEIVKRIGLALKEALSLPYAKHYIIISILMTLFFIILTFPFDILIRNKLQEIEGSVGKGLYVGNVNFSIIDNTNIDNMTIILNDGTEINLKDIGLDLSLNPYTTLINKILKGNIVIRNIGYDAKKISLTGALKSDFHMKFNNFSDYPSRGKLIVKIEGLSVKGFTIKGFDIPPVKFTSVIAEMNIMNKRINIKDLVFSGQDLRGNIKGAITFSKFIKYSKIDLDIQIDSNSTLLDNYKILLGEMLNSENKLIISIKGTISNPKINFPEKMETGINDLL